MENKKQSLYSKYRPQTFDQVVGQKVAKEILVNSIAKDKINHAYLFYGIRGTGKTTLARIFAKSINCENPVNNNPCNECSMCKSINSNSAFDVIEIDAASNNGVDEIRTIKENTTFTTTSSKYKVYIIDEVHMLSKAAFNALLKTLEEPPRNTIFLLATTELHKIPQTVLSRTVVINLEVMSDLDIKEGLEVILKGEGVAYEINALDYLIMTSGGSLRDAISALETTLLYNDELSVNNVLSSLGLINKEELQTLIVENIEGLIELIDDSNKDPKKLSLLILEVIMHLIKNGETKYINVLNDLMNAVNTVKDPVLLKIALKTAFYSVNVSRETMVEVEKVSRETSQSQTPVKEESVESVENSPKTPQKETIIETKQETPVVEKVVENSTTPVENKIVENKDTMVVKAAADYRNELKIITDYADINTYMYVIKKNDADLLTKVVNRWKFKDSYITRVEFKDILTSLSATQPLAATNKSIIVGFKDEKHLNEYKRLSLTKEFIEFTKEFLGDYKFVLPVNEDTWTKLLIAKDSVELTEKHSDIKVKPEDFLPCETEEMISKATSLFGEGNLKHE